VTRLHLTNENNARLPVEVVAPKALGLELAAIGPGSAVGNCPVRLTVVRIEDDSVLARQNPVYVATEIGFLNDKYEVARTLKADGDVEAVVREVTEARKPALRPPAARPVPPNPPAQVGLVDRVRAVPVWAWGTGFLLLTGVGVGALAIVVVVFRSVRRRTSRPADRDDDGRDEAGQLV
jgi:hypothetical protein